MGAGGAREYLGILQLAAQHSEAGVDAALRHLIDRGESISRDAVKQLVESAEVLPLATAVNIADVDLAGYDALLGVG